MNQLDATDEQLERLFRMANFTGFTGEICGSCRRTANVMSGGLMWECVCGHYNDTAWHNSQIPHMNPDIGPSRGKIIQAAERARQS